MSPILFYLLVPSMGWLCGVGVFGLIECSHSLSALHNGLQRIIIIIIIINLLRVVGKIYGRVLIKRVRAGTECTIGDEQCEFRQGRGCMDPVIAVRQVCEKYLANGKDLFGAFMDLEKAYDTIDRHGMWQMVRVYGVAGKLLIVVKSFYLESWACVRVGNDVSEWFPFNFGLRQSCIMFPWLFNVYMDGVVHKVNVRVLGKGLELLSANGGRFVINQLFFVDDTALVADSEEIFCRLVSELCRV